MKIQQYKSVSTPIVSFSMLTKKIFINVKLLQFFFKFSSYNRIDFILYSSLQYTKKEFYLQFFFSTNLTHSTSIPYK